MDVNDRFKYIDDLSILEILSISGALTEFDCWQTVPSDIGIDQKYLPPESCATQGHIDQISAWTGQPNANKCFQDQLYDLHKDTD